MFDLFILRLANPEDRFFVIAWYLIVIISIVIHELAHGWMAIRLGDNTPIQLGRMTGNPLVHMGGMSLIALLLFGLAWGQMPIDPSRMRGRYADAKVSFAGPASNLILSALALIGLGLLIRFTPTPELQWEKNLHEFLFLAGSANLLLCVFNLVPIPPLDGSHILANFHRGYDNLRSDPGKQGIFMLGFFMVFITFGQLWGHVYKIASAVSTWIATVGG